MQKTNQKNFKSTKPLMVTTHVKKYCYSYWLNFPHIFLAKSLLFLGGELCKGHLWATSDS